MAEKIIQIDSVDAYNKLYGWETLHPLVTVVRHTETLASLNHSRLNYGLYALFLKQGEGCSIRYGREKYDYQEGTVVSFKPGQVVEVEWDESKPMPASRGLLFHSDLIYGTPLAKRIHDYTFFDYDQREALHLSEREQRIVIDLSKQYVMDHELTINQVAYKLGFQYPQHFTRLFKKEVGVTPSEYRN